MNTSQQKQDEQESQKATASEKLSETVSPKTKYSMNEVATRLSELLGYSVSRTSVWRWINRRKNPLPCRKPASRLVFDEYRIAAWAETPKIPNAVRDAKNKEQKEGECS